MLAVTLRGVDFHHQKNSQRALPHKSQRRGFVGPLDGFVVGVVRSHGCLLCIVCGEHNKQPAAVCACELAHFFLSTAFLASWCSSEQEKAARSLTNIEFLWKTPCLARGSEAAAPTARSRALHAPQKGQQLVLSSRQFEGACTAQVNRGSLSGTNVVPVLVQKFPTGTTSCPALAASRTLEC